MSPRRRSHGRHGGVGAVAARDAQGSVAAESIAQPIERPAAEGPAADDAEAPHNGVAEAPHNGVAEAPHNGVAEAPHNGVPHAHGGRPNAGGGSTDGQARGQRRQPRGRPDPRPAGFAPRAGRAPGPSTAAAQDSPAPDGDAPAAPMPPAPPLQPPAFDEDGNPIPGRHANCTLAQMRRFIKSRPYVPVHELRRRFEIVGIEDEVSPVATGTGTIYVGLPAEQAGFLGELIRSGDIGCEMLLDPTSPGVVGVFPMRPVARQ